MKKVADQQEYVNNPRYAASQKSSMMGGLITGMHTKHGYFDTLGTSNPDDKPVEDIETEVKKDLDEDSPGAAGEDE